MAKTCWGCHRENVVGMGKLVCAACWKLIPRKLQTRLYAAWNDGDETDDYSDACDAVFEAIRLKREATLGTDG